MFANLGLCNAYITVTRSLLDWDLSSSKVESCFPKGKKECELSKM
jgi:hypothetical protein